MRIALACDHAAYRLKVELIAALAEWGHDVIDLGTHSEARVDYPDYGDKLARAMADGSAQSGVALCGSGIGMAIAVNRHAACRAALVTDPYAATLARQHNDANVIAMGARLIGVDQAKACLEAFLAGTFAGGRHGPRVAKLSPPTA